MLLLLKQEQDSGKEDPSPACSPGPCGAAGLGWGGEGCRGSVRHRGAAPFRGAAGADTQVTAPACPAGGLAPRGSYRAGSGAHRGGAGTEINGRRFSRSPSGPHLPPTGPFDIFRVGSIFSITKLRLRP